MGVEQTVTESMPGAGVRDDAAVYAAHAEELVRFATVLVGSNDAQDVVSSAVLRSIAAPGWSRVRQPRAYLYAAVANEARNLRRAEARRRMREQAVAPSPAIVHGDPRPEVRAAVERLSVRQRAVVYLAYWEDMTDRMIAEHLGIGAGSVRRHLARARSRLRRVLDE